MWYPIFVVSLWEVISSNKSCIISILLCAVIHHFSPSTLSFFSPLPPFFTPLYSLFPLQPPPVFHLPPPSLSLSLSPTIFTPPYSLFSHPHPHQFSPPSHSLSLPPLPPFFTPLPLSLSPPPLVLTFLPLSLLPPPLSYPPNCQYTLAYGLNDLCTEVSAELLKAGFK